MQLLQGSLVSLWIFHICQKTPTTSLDVLGVFVVFWNFRQNHIDEEDKKPNHIEDEDKNANHIDEEEASGELTVEHWGDNPLVTTPGHLEIYLDADHGDCK